MLKRIRAFFSRAKQTSTLPDFALHECPENLEVEPSDSLAGQLESVEDEEVSETPHRATELTTSHVSLLRKPQTNCFSMLEPTLDELYAKTREIYGNETRLKIRDALQALSNSYWRDTKVVSYEGIATQFAYLYSYAPGRASVLCRIMEQCSQLRELFDRQNLRVVCLGGGPGTEILGMLKYRYRNRGGGYIDATVVDREHDWQQVWQLIESSGDASRYAKVSYAPMDVCSASVIDIPGAKPDLTVLSYSLSEFCVRPVGARSFLNGWLDRSSSGAFLIVVDNGDKRYQPQGHLSPGLRPLAHHEMIADLVDSHQLIKLADVPFASTEVEGDEKRSAMSQWTKFGLGSDTDEFKAIPQLNFRAAYWILQKP